MTGRPWVQSQLYYTCILLVCQIYSYRPKGHSLSNWCSHHTGHNFQLFLFSFFMQISIFRNPGKLLGFWEMLFFTKVVCFESKLEIFGHNGKKKKVCFSFKDFRFRRENSVSVKICFGPKPSEWKPNWKEWKKILRVTKTFWLESFSFARSQGPESHKKIKDLYLLRDL